MKLTKLAVAACLLLPVLLSAMYHLQRMPQHCEK
jgi:hypothetical protein